MTTPHLWEIDHPYYCTEGNYYARPSEGLHTEYETWQDFHADWGSLDPDLNFVWRWDWKRADPSHYEDGEEMPPDRLLVFWVLQRKAILRSTECTVTEADEPAVREWLAEKAEWVRAVWEPFLPVPEGAAS
ncbi:hypothetical protein [Streptomyces aidingensis]|uniref:Uncharacterized protein n=1 Tax=Streptomyces aidingensis TaxID=910347 RepID=A0A1I1PT98_9ACTN|nr:hypothetical protein [Streptomyces aidingensis]SFD13121.1 hypothetical protein SAMN05421773_11039 [Streptomyces aidingensis]